MPQFGLNTPGQTIRVNGTPDAPAIFDARTPEDLTAMPRAMGWSAEPLHRMALVIRAADTDRHDLAPQAAGLLALSVGLSRMFRDVLQQLEAGMTLDDALYRWARDGYEEAHDWPAGRNA